MSLYPLDTEDDAEWEIWKLDEDGYAVTSVFSITPCPFQSQEKVLNLLDRHGLGFYPHNDYVQGIAYFAAIETGCLTDAVNRLTWLEIALRDLNEKYNSLSDSFWQSIKLESDKVVQNLPVGYNVEEIIPLPQIYIPAGWKR